MRKIDLQWIFVLFGTAVGAGILFLPLQAAQSGFISLLIGTALVIPMIYFAEKNVASMVMGYADKDMGLTEVFSKELGGAGAFISTIIYLLSCYTVVLAYAISLPNAFVDFISIFDTDNIHIKGSMWLSFFLFFGLIVIVELGKKVVLRVMSYVIYPLAAALLIVSLMLIPKWNIDFIAAGGVSVLSIIKGLIMVIPILVFSMNFSQSISEMGVYYKQEYIDSKQAENRVYKNIKIGTVLIISFTMFFTFSTIMSLDPEQVKIALSENQTILSRISDLYDISILGYLAPLIAVAGIISSFIGVYLGTRESLRGVIIQVVHKDTESVRRGSTVLTEIFVVSFIFVTLWLASIFNPSIISILGQLTAPCIALMIFFLPLIIVYKSKELIGYRNMLLSIFLAIAGLVVVLGYFIGSYI